VQQMESVWKWALGGDRRDEHHHSIYHDVIPMLVWSFWVMSGVALAQGPVSLEIVSTEG
jgi:hypothetical protein